MLLMQLGGLMLRPKIVRESDAMRSDIGKLRTAFRDDRVLVLLVLDGFVFIGHCFFCVATWLGVKHPVPAKRR